MKEINEHSHSAAGPVNGLMTYLPVGSLHPHPDNPRKDLGDLTPPGFFGKRPQGAGGQHPGKRHFSESDCDSC